MKERSLKFWQIWKVKSKVINCSVEVETKQKFLRGRNILQSITRWFQYIYKKLQNSIVIFKCKWKFLVAWKFIIILPLFINFFTFINLNSSNFF